MIEMRYSKICAFLVSMLVSAVAVADLTLTRDGKALSVIVVGDDPTPTATGAATHLQGILEKVSGAVIPVRQEAGGEEAVILVGQSAAKPVLDEAGIDIPSGFTNRFDEEGYVIVADDRYLILVGNETEPYQGNYHAVYGFLDSLGCRWYFPGQQGEILPNLPTIRVPPVSETRRPAFRVRHLWYSGHLAFTQQDERELTVWKARNRFSHRHFYVNARWNSKWLQDPSDNTAQRLLPPEKYFETRPELYALNEDGSRNRLLPCPSSTEAIEESAKTIVELFESNPGMHCFGLSPEDATVLCHEPESLRLNYGGLGEIQGNGRYDIADVWFGFVGKLARKVKQANPDILIGTMAYANRFRTPVATYEKWDNVYVQIAPLGQCPLHSYTDPKCPNRQRHAKVIKKWSEISVGTIQYEYDPHGWDHLQSPKWASRRISEDFAFFRSVGGWGFNIEGMNAWASLGINYWLRGRLAWEPEADVDALVERFCHEFFGPAEEPMLRYYRRTERTLYETKIHYHNNFGEDYLSIYDRNYLDASLGDLDRAEQLAAGDKTYARRVEIFRIAFERLNHSKLAHEAAVRGDYEQARNNAQGMLEAVERMGDPMWLQDRGPLWEATFAGQTQARLYSHVLKQAGANGIVAVLPETSLFKRDDLLAGVIDEWYADDYDPVGWRTINTTQSWACQEEYPGVWGRYDGIAWYRMEFQLSEAQVVRARKLRIPGATYRGMWVWVNGRMVGHLEPKHATYDFNVTEILRPGDNNVVIRFDALSGLWLPPVLY